MLRVSFCFFGEGGRKGRTVGGVVRGGVGWRANGSMYDVAVAVATGVTAAVGDGFVVAGGAGVETSFAIRGPAGRSHAQRVASVRFCSDFLFSLSLRISAKVRLGFGPVALVVWAKAVALTALNCSLALVVYEKCGLCLPGDVERELLGEEEGVEWVEGGGRCFDGEVDCGWEAVALGTRRTLIFGGLKGGELVAPVEESSRWCRERVALPKPIGFLAMAGALDDSLIEHEYDPCESELLENSLSLRN